MPLCANHCTVCPHKKNPDVFELIRAKSNKLQSLPQQVMLIMNNLPVGYFRDLQIIKEVFLPAFDELKDCLQIDRKSTRLNSSHLARSRMPSSA